MNFYEASCSSMRKIINSAGDLNPKEGAHFRSMLTLTSKTFFLTTRHFSSVSDVAIVGGGIVGCATARELAIRNPGWKIAVLEKEDTLGKCSKSSVLM